jgi:hypothetical protein
VSDERMDDEKTLYRGESALVYCFDYQDFPEVTAGQTLSNPTAVVSSGSAALVTLGLAEINLVAFEERDRDGVVQRSVPAGAGAKVAVTPPAVGGPKGECVVTCLVSPSGGGKIGKRCRFIVK